MYKIVLFVIFFCSIGYPFSSEGSKIKFRNGSSRYNLKDGETCYTEEGTEGYCLPINKCPEITDLIKSRGGIQSKGTADVIRKRVCNFASKEARVCCVPETVPNHPLIPSHDECGTTFVSKIYNGEYFKHGTHPWLVGVGYMKDKKSLKVECGGTLITKRHVLSAAHCFDRTGDKINEPEFTHVILGEHSLSENIERQPPIILKIADKLNPGYNVSLHYRDIELLVLETDVQFNSFIYPACLPFKLYESKFNFRNNMTVAGWGRTAYVELRGPDRPKQAMVPLVPLEECKKDFEGFSNVHIDKTQICLGGNDRDTCGGDSGGPAIYFDNGISDRYYVVGITAFGVGGCGDQRFPAVYTYVPEYVDWIVQNL